MIEQLWIPVPGFEPLEVSSHGQVRGFINKEDAPPYLSGGYLKVTHQGQNLYVHRCVLLAFQGLPTEDRPLGLHWDDDKLNNRIDNLRWGSSADNSRDWIRNKFSKK